MLSINNYKIAFLIVSKSSKQSKGSQEHFHQHFVLAEDNDMRYWKVTLIGSWQLEELQCRGGFWQYKLKTHFLQGLNKSKVH